MPVVGTHQMRYLLIVLFCSTLYADDRVVILHKGDPVPPPGVLYSYDSKETEEDFNKRRGQQSIRRSSPEGGSWPVPPKCSPKG